MGGCGSDPQDGTRTEPLRLSLVEDPKPALGKLRPSQTHTSQPSRSGRTGSARVLQRAPSERPAGAEAAFLVSRTEKAPRSSEQGRWGSRDVSKVSGVGAVGPVLREGGVLEAPLSQ